MANSGHAPADFETEVGQFRLMIGDTDPKDVADSVGTYVFYSDDEITGLIKLAGGSVKAAAIQALRFIAGSQVMLLKAFTSADLSVNGPAIADALRAVAKDLEAGMAADALGEVGTFVVPTGGFSWSGQRVLDSDETALDFYGYGREIDRYGSFI